MDARKFTFQFFFIVSHIPASDSCMASVRTRAETWLTKQVNFYVRDQNEVHTVGGTYSSLMIMSPLPHTLQCWRPAGELNKKTKTRSNTNIA